MTPTNHLELTPAPLFAILPEMLPGRFRLDPPPPRPERLAGAVSPVVIQALLPEDSIVLNESAYRFSSRAPGSVPLFLYNFSDQTVTGRLRVTVPNGWKAGPLGEVAIAPQSRAEVKLELDCGGGSSRVCETMRITGDFGVAGNPVLSLRVMPEP